MKMLTALACFLLIPGALGISVEGGTSAIVYTNSGPVGGITQTDGSSATKETIMGSAADVQQNLLIRDSIGRLLSSRGTIYVSPGTGVIQSAVDAATDGDRIKLVKGNYIDNVEIDKSLWIEGLSRSKKAVVEGAVGGGSVFKIDPGIDVTLANMIIQGGTGTATELGTCGGGIYNQGDLTIKDCIIGTANLMNSAQYGGGIFNDGGTVAMSRCTVENNLAWSSGDDASSSGGGIYNNGTMDLKGCKILGNLAYAFTDAVDGTAEAAGGGISNYDTMSISSSLVSGNSLSSKSVSGESSALGGGIYNRDGTMRLRSNVKILANTARAVSCQDDGFAFATGGGLSVQSGALDFSIGTKITGNMAIAESILYAGTAEALGGGIFVDDAAEVIGKSGTIIYNSVITSDPTAQAYGGGLYTRGTANLRYGKVSINSASLGGGVYREQGILNLDPRKVTKNTPDNIYDALDEDLA